MKELRTLCPNVQVIVSTVPEIIGRGLHVEREGKTANREIQELAKAMDFAFVDINTDVRRVGWKRGFQQDRVHFIGQVGDAIWQRHAARVVAFLKGSQACVRREKTGNQGR